MPARPASKGSLLLAGQRVSWNELLTGCSTLLSWMTLLARKRRLGRQRVERWEFERVAERQERMLGLSALLADWPNQFVATAAEHHLTQRSLVAWPQPSWLAASVHLLPTGIVHDRGGVARALRKSLRQVHRYKQPGWRSTRARLIVEAALA